VDFLVDRGDLRKTRITEDGSPAPLDPGEARVRVEKFALTANNVSYGVFGEAMSYWDFFPAPEGFGRIPVWGFAEVTESRHEGVEEGERIFGYLPMSTELALRPGRVAPASFVDAAPHRGGLPAAYQRYARVSKDPDHDPRHEDHQALLFPLYFTSVLLEDFLSDRELFGAERAVIASASSKTALGTAFLLSERRVEVVGLTSPRNVEFCQRVGYYDSVLPYGEVASLPRQPPTVFIDMAGDAELLAAVHRHLSDRLRHSSLVGASHWEAGGSGQELPGPRPEFFFAPTQFEKRQKDWGPGGVERRFAEAWGRFLASVEGWLRIVRGHGPAAVESRYHEVLEGKAKPDEGFVLFWADGDG
jgi:hypothetical protein